MYFTFCFKFNVVPDEYVDVFGPFSIEQLQQYRSGEFCATFGYLFLYYQKRYTMKTLIGLRCIS